MNGRWILVLLVILVGLGGAAVVFATQPPPVESPSLTLMVEQGTVEVKHAAGEWLPITGTIDLVVGDEVRTGIRSEATINVFDQGVDRLAEQTTITISEATFDEATSTLTSRLTLQNGKIWSKLLDFLSPQSIYAVETASSVATVRGTSFFVESDGADNEQFFVDTHLVEVEARGQRVQVSEGQMMKWASDAEQGIRPVFSKREALPSSAQQWIERQHQNDEVFVEQMKMRNEQRLRDLSVARPGTMMNGLIEQAETIRLFATVDPTQKAQLQERFAMRKFAGATIAAMEGDEGTMQSMLNASKQLQQNNLSPEGGRSMNLLMRSMVDGKELSDLPVPVLQEIQSRFPEQKAGIELYLDRQELFSHDPAFFQPDAVQGQPELQPLQLQPLLNQPIVQPTIQPIQPLPTSTTQPQLQPAPVFQPNPVLSPINVVVPAPTNLEPIRIQAK